MFRIYYSFKKQVICESPLSSIPLCVALMPALHNSYAVAMETLIPSLSALPKPSPQHPVNYGTQLPPLQTINCLFLHKARRIIVFCTSCHSMLDRGPRRTCAPPACLHTNNEQ